MTPYCTPHFARHRTLQETYSKIKTSGGQDIALDLYQKQFSLNGAMGIHKGTLRKRQCTNNTYYSLIFCSEEMHHNR